ncbi:MAG: ROK family protein [Chitinophagales bacterium]
MTKKLLAGIDLGGTKILSGLFDEDGTLLDSIKMATRAETGMAETIKRMTGSITSLMESCSEGLELTGLVVGIPGPVDTATGYIYDTPNLGWKDIELARLLQQSLGVPVWLENDGNLAALGEYLYGYKESFPTMLYLTASTGVGGGIIINGRIHRGADGTAGEFGHMTIIPEGLICHCGNRGCLETLASGSAVARKAKERVLKGYGVRMMELAHNNLERIDARLVGEAADQGDEEAELILNEAFTYLGIGAANLVNMFNPHAIVIGGGLASLTGRCFAAVKREIEQRTFHRSWENLQVLPVKLNGMAGLMGCFALWEQELKKI